MDKRSMSYKDRQAAMRQTVEFTVKQAGILVEKTEYVYASAIEGFSAKLTDEEVEVLRKDPNVDYIEQDQLITMQMGGPPPGGGGNNPPPPPPQVTPYGIDRVGGPANGSGKKAWIIDTGIDLDHPDLNVDVANSKSFLTGGGPNKSPEDKNGHGTHVAGTVAAIDNTIGVVGVAAGASVVAVRVLGKTGSGTVSGVIAGINYVAANADPTDVANMSLIGGASTSLDNAVITASGTCPFSLAAGNSASNANNYSPARVNVSDIYTISAMDSNDKWATFSNFANPPIDFCAPGVAVYSTYKEGGYATISGTSMSAPHVAGILLLGIVSSDGTVTNDPDGNPDPIAHQ